jgi:hypothetical protein
VRISFVGMKKGRRNIYCDSPLVFYKKSSRLAGFHPMKKTAALIT